MSENQCEKARQELVIAEQALQNQQGNPMNWEGEQGEAYQQELARLQSIVAQKRQALRECENV